MGIFGNFREFSETFGNFQECPDFVNQMQVIYVGMYTNDEISYFLNNIDG